jgi:hypothetical protein
MLSLNQVDNNNNNCNDYVFEGSLEKTREEEAGKATNCVEGKWIIWHHCVVPATDTTITGGQGEWQPQQ